MIAMLLLLLHASVFDEQVVPIASPETSVVLAHADGDTVADVCVLSERELTIYSSARGFAQRTVVFEPGTTAFDIASLDGSGAPEIVAVEGTHIVRYRLGPEEAPRAETLFEMDTQLNDKASPPYPYVLVTSYGGQLLLALPGEHYFELKRPNGEVVLRFPIGGDAPKRVMLGRPFRAWTLDRALLSKATGLEGQVSHILEYEPDIPADVLALDKDAWRQPQAGATQVRDASGLPFQNWPWFPLSDDRQNGDRALYALAPPAYRETIVHISRARAAGSESEFVEHRIGPPRRYLGCTLASERLPDFNGDGLTDLVLWHAPSPGTSIDALGRAITSETWPVRILVHPYAPEAQRFRAAATGVIDLRLPIAWFLALQDGSPLHHAVLNDFDGDGQTDFACALDERSLAIWLHQAGFSRAPSQVIRLEEPIERVEFDAALAGIGPATLGLRTASALHLLRPRQTRAGEP